MDDFNDALKHSGLKCTRRRVAVLEVLDKKEQPIAAEQVYIELKEKCISINLSTVYRILEVFTDVNLVKKSLIGEDSRVFFELNRMKHKHQLICLKCRKMFSVEGCPLGDYEKKLTDKTGFEAIGHKLEFYGYCQNCKAHKI